MDLPEPVGSEPAGARPVLVVSNDSGNQAGSVVICAIVSEATRAPYPQNVAVPDSVGVIGTIMCGQLFTIDKTRLRDCEGELGNVEMWEVNAALKASLDIP